MITILNHFYNLHFIILSTSSSLKPTIVYELIRQQKIIPQKTSFAKQNVFIFIITRTYRYLKNSQSVLDSAIVGNKR